MSVEIIIYMHVMYVNLFSAVIVINIFIDAIDYSVNNTKYVLQVYVHETIIVKCEIF